MTAERRRSRVGGTERRQPGNAIGYLWCRRCQDRITVAGRSPGMGDGPTIDLVVCPNCRTMRRMVLPPNVAAPFRVVTPTGKRRDE